MKNKMKLVVIGIAALLAMVNLSAFAAGGTTYINGTTNTIVNAGGVVSAANSIQTSVVNTFNLSTTAGSQSDTNKWPSCPLKIQENVFNPSRILNIQQSFNAMGSDSGTITNVYAGSVDGTHWVTPILTIITTVNGTTTVSTGTNFDRGAWQYINLYSQGNGAGGVITNNTIVTGFNRGL